MRAGCSFRDSDSAARSRRAAFGREAFKVVLIDVKLG